MEQDTEYTKVVFRKWRDTGDVIALMPDLPWSDLRGYMCTTYMHIGQHSGGCYTVVLARTVPAKPSEYASLLSELESIGYRVKVRKRA